MHSGGNSLDSIRCGPHWLARAPSETCSLRARAAQCKRLADTALWYAQVLRGATLIFPSIIFAANKKIYRLNRIVNVGTFERNGTCPTLNRQYERRKILNGSRHRAGDNFFKAFAHFEEKHPDLIREAQFGDVSIVVMQTPFMVSKLVKSTIDDEAVNGIVSDAAHRVWQERNSLLIVSSTFEPSRLKCWVHGIMSYANSGTGEHYRIHFFHMMDSMADECDSRNIPVTDDLFANVGDYTIYSVAQRKGFILGFVDFWLKRAPNERSIEELLEAAVKLLKGCAQHFRGQVTRVKKISGVVDPSITDIFENYARELLQCETIDEFNDVAGRFINDFPRAERWIRWWMLPAHACMLFPSFRVMNEAL
ncbi:hypothetical protein MVEN_00015300 [Mycena venus]|uniref:Uncharacterized protein n=1 Tax=Mycena venus TaxID=2733690 RepID=A0A8H6Z6Q0_9AGAR|nr:hypothetical protein MVEN_00015300 [Mycena venus]